MTPRPPSQRIERITFNGAPAWVKHACRSKITFWHRLQKHFSRLIPFPMIRPTVSLGGSEALAFEAAQLRVLKHHDFRVPSILAEESDQIILSDIGQSLTAYLASEPHPEARLAALECAATTLARLHDSGLFHGRPHVKDMVYRPGFAEVGFLDLEENPLSVMPLETAQERDFWLFLCSCGRYVRDNEADIERVARAYIASRQDAFSIPANLRRLARLLKPLCVLVEKCAYGFVGQDVRNVVIVNRMLLNFSGESSA